LGGPLRFGNIVQITRIDSCGVFICISSAASVLKSRFEGF